MEENENRTNQFLKMIKEILGLYEEISHVQLEFFRNKCKNEIKEEIKKQRKKTRKEDFNDEIKSTIIEKALGKATEYLRRDLWSSTQNELTLEKVMFDHASKLNEKQLAARWRTEEAENALNEAQKFLSGDQENIMKVLPYILTCYSIRGPLSRTYNNENSENSILNGKNTDTNISKKINTVQSQFTELPHIKWRYRFLEDDFDIFREDSRETNSKAERARKLKLEDARNSLYTAEIIRRFFCFARACSTIPEVDPAFSLYLLIDEFVSTEKRDNKEGKRDNTFYLLTALIKDECDEDISPIVAHEPKSGALWEIEKILEKEEKNRLSDQLDTIEAKTKHKKLQKKIYRSMDAPSGYASDVGYFLSYAFSNYVETYQTTVLKSKMTDDSSDNTIK